MTRPSTFSQYKTLLKKDLRQEFRTREMLTAMGIYALLVIIVYGAALALTARGIDIAHMGGGLLWVLIVFTSLLGLGRSFAHEKEQGCMEGILLVPIDRSVVFLAKATANILFMCAVEVIAVPLFYFFFMTGQPAAPTLPAIVAPLIVGTIGMAGIGTMHYSTFLHYNVIGGLTWVGLFTGAGYFFGNIPFVKENFSHVALGIIIVSVLPIVYEFIKAKTGKE